MGWLGRRFIQNYDNSCVSDEPIFLSKEEEIKSDKNWLDRKMKDRLYPILDKLRYGYLKIEDINKDNFKNYLGVFIQEEWDWFQEFKNK